MKYIELYNAFAEGLFRQGQVFRDAILYACNNLIAFRALGHAVRQGIETVITPGPIQDTLIKYLGQILTQVDISSIKFVNPSASAEPELPRNILSDDLLLHTLRENTNCGEACCITPRTYTPETIALAEELGTYHAHVMPTGLFGDKEIDGIYPTSDYLREHSIDKLNSKVENYKLTRTIAEELDLLDCLPDGGIAYEEDVLLGEVEKLIKQGKRVVLKADLSVDGEGNIFLDPKTLVNSEGTQYSSLSDEQKKKLILSLLDEKQIPMNQQNGVLISERIENVIAIPSSEFYTPPIGWNEATKMYYRCSMVIEHKGEKQDGHDQVDPQGGFAGSIIPDQPPKGVDPDKYQKAIEKVERLAMAVADHRMKEGYVGISDADMIVYIDDKGDVKAKLIETNYARETGGTVAYYYNQAIAKYVGHPVTTIALDAIGIPVNTDSIDDARKYLEERNIHWNGSEGVIITGLLQKSGKTYIVPLAVGEDYQKSLYYMNKLKDLP